MPLQSVVRGSPEVLFSANEGSLNSGESLTCLLRRVATVYSTDRRNGQVCPADLATFVPAKCDFCHGVRSNRDAIMGLHSSNASFVWKGLT